MLPRAFKSVLFLDVFGWVSQKGWVDLSCQIHMVHFSALHYS